MTTYSDQAIEVADSHRYLSLSSSQAVTSICRMVPGTWITSRHVEITEKVCFSTKRPSPKTLFWPLERSGQCTS